MMKKSSRSGIAMLALLLVAAYDGNSVKQASAFVSPGSISTIRSDRVTTLTSNPVTTSAATTVMTCAMRKRDRLRKWGSSSVSTLSRFKLRGRVSKLSAKNENKNSDDENSKKLIPMMKEMKDKIDEKYFESVEALQAKLPAPITQKFIPWFVSIQGQLKLGVVTFTAGIVFSFVAIFVPVYNQVEQLAEPVTLFETILTDLEQGYVDKVDTQKLFETGISAMLNSLDPYTEFEGRQEAQSLTESIEGKYGGVGLVISGSSTEAIQKMQQKEAAQPASSMQPKLKDGDISSSNPVDEDYIDGLEDYDDEFIDEVDAYTMAMTQRSRSRGIQVVTAFEGYAFDYGMRVGDRLVAIDGRDIGKTTSVDDVRNMLRGEPGSEVTIAYEREGVQGVQKVTMPRTVVRLRDVKLATLIGKPQDGIGYIQLSGFTSEAGKEVRNAILSLQAQTLDATDGAKTLQGLVLDLRGNPGGLLTSAVDVSSLLVPNGSDIVSARGRGFPGLIYRSRIDPILDPSKTKLAVLVNGGTASAAEIVSGAVQDLDVGVIVGSDRTFGKGLVQNVEALPFNTALKFTVAKYYTPSGRCIQGINYSEGGGLGVKNSKYIETKVKDEDRKTYYTRNGRIVKDGGGIEADFKVETPKASALEVTLLRSGVFADFAAEWSKTHQLTNNFNVDDDTYKEFQNYVAMKQEKGEIKLEGLYLRGINDLKKVLKQSGYKGSEMELAKLQETIVQEAYKEFDKYKTDIKEDISQNILARYLPESMLIERSIKNDKQVEEAVKLVANQKKFDTMLAKGSDVQKQGAGSNTLNVATAASTRSTPEKQQPINVMNREQELGVMMNFEW